MTNRNGDRERPARDLLRCAQCGLPIAEIQNGCLVILSRHHGERHVNAIPLAELVRRAGGAPAPAWELDAEPLEGWSIPEPFP